jgi:uncharacterized nucleotidyltransferase DUF6036
MPDFGRILAGLNEADLPYVLVGGLSVGVHGYVRLTKDADVIVPTDPETMDSARRLLEGWGATQLDGTPLPDELFDGEQVIVSQTPFGRLDLMPEGEAPLDYATLRERAIRSEVDGTEVWVVDLQGLVTLKEIAGRPDDRRDLERLRLAHGELPPSLLD